MYHVEIFEKIVLDAVLVIRSFHAYCISRPQIFLLWSINASKSWHYVCSKLILPDSPKYSRPDTQSEYRPKWSATPRHRWWTNCFAMDTSRQARLGVENIPQDGAWTTRDHFPSESGPWNNSWIFTLHSGRHVWKHLKIRGASLGVETGNLQRKKFWVFTHLSSWSYNFTQRRMVSGSLHSTNFRKPNLTIPKA